jgi:hypothetical protein
MQDHNMQKLQVNLSTRSEDQATAGTNKLCMSTRFMFLTCAAQNSTLEQCAGCADAVMQSTALLMLLLLPVPL